LCCVAEVRRKGTGSEKPRAGGCRFAGVTESSILLFRVQCLPGVSGVRIFDAGADAVGDLGRGEKPLP